MSTRKVHLGSGTMTYNGVSARVTDLVLTVDIAPTVDQVFDSTYEVAPVAALDNPYIRDSRRKEAQWKREQRGRGRR